MPRTGSEAERAQRNRAIRADRARGYTFRKLAAQYGLSVGMVHKVAGDVHPQLLPAWHRARIHDPEPLVLPCVHLFYLPDRRQ